MHIPVSRWGEPYKSLEVDKVVHFATGEPLAEVSRANAGLVERDMRHAQRARDVLREIPIKDLLQMVKKAADLYTKAELPLGDGTQTPDAVRAHAVGDDRLARAHVPVQHGEEPLRASTRWTRSSTP